MKNDFIRKELRRAPQKLFLFGTLTVPTMHWNRPIEQLKTMVHFANVTFYQDS
jgi:hypothetical protein